MRVDLWSNVELVAYADELYSSLAQKGIVVVPRFLVPRDDYRSITTNLGRAWFRFRAYVGYPLLLATDFAVRRHPDVSIVTTNTFFAPWLASRLAAGRRRVVHLVYDLFPEALVTAGKLASGGPGARVISAMTKDTFHRSAANVFLGHRLLGYATARYGAIPRSAVIPVGAASSPFADRPPLGRPPGTPPQILYCGNLGWMHDIQTFAHACFSTAQDGECLPIRVRFHATGPRLRDLKRMLGFTETGDTRSFPSGLSVTLAGPIADRDWRDAMLAADVGLVTMVPGAETVVMPSKTYSAMVAGQAILAVCPLESDLADLVLGHDCGWVVIPEGDRDAARGDPSRKGVFYGSDGLREVLRLIATDRDELQRKRSNAFDAGHRLFSSSAVAQQWTSLLDRLSAARPDSQPSSATREK